MKQYRNIKLDSEMDEEEEILFEEYEEFGELEEYDEDGLREDEYTLEEIPQEEFEEVE